jgi:hypothetical protein
VLVAWIAIIAGFSLPWPLYLPGIFVAGVLWLVASVLYSIARSSRRTVAAAIEHRILELAARTPGPLTIPDTARALGLSLADAEAALVDMARAGHVITDVELDTGHLHFTLPIRLASAPQDIRP